MILLRCSPDARSLERRRHDKGRREAHLGRAGLCPFQRELLNRRCRSPVSRRCRVRPRLQRGRCRRVLGSAVRSPCVDRRVSWPRDRQEPFGHRLFRGHSVMRKSIGGAGGSGARGAPRGRSCAPASHNMRRTAPNDRPDSSVSCRMLAPCSYRVFKVRARVSRCAPAIRLPREIFCVSINSLGQHGNSG